jgi:hypothetical protein
MDPTETVDIREVLDIPTEVKSKWNGTHLAEPNEREPRLGPGALRRLARLGAAVEGATDVAQAAISAHSVRRSAYQQAFEAACEDVGLQIPPGPHEVGIDWATGAVTFTPQSS